MKPHDVSEPRTEVAEMQARAELPNALMGGTTAMRLAGRSYLPQMAMERDKDYLDRLNSTVLLPHFSETVDDFTTKPFTEPATYDALPAEIEGWLDNADLMGQDGDQFFMAVWHQALVDGVGFVLVDHPPTPVGATLADERAAGARPYLVHVPLANLIGWRSKTINGKHVLTQVRIREVVTEDSGEWGVEDVVQIRVLEPNAVRVYRQNARKEWALVPELSGVVTLGEVPLVPVYTGRKGFMIGVPPLEGLAHLNVQHWQSSSDQRNILHVARVPFLFGKGLDAPKDGAEQAHGPNLMITANQPDADIKFVEHEGRAIEAGRQDLKDIEEAMRQISGELVSTVTRTATEAGIDADQNCSWLKAQVIQFERSINEVLRLMGAWQGITHNATVALFKDFEQEQVDAAMLTAMTGAAEKGLLSKQTFLQILQDAGKLPESVELDAELQRLDDEEAKMLAAMPKPAPAPSPVP